MTFEEGVPPERQLPWSARVWIPGERSRRLPDMNDRTVRMNKDAYFAVASGSSDPWSPQGFGEADGLNPIDGPHVSDKLMA